MKAETHQYEEMVKKIEACKVKELKEKAEIQAKETGKLRSDIDVLKKGNSKIKMN